MEVLGLGGGSMLGEIEVVGGVVVLVEEDDGLGGEEVDAGEVSCLSGGRGTSRTDFFWL